MGRGGIDCRCGGVRGADWIGSASDHGHNELDVLVLFLQAMSYADGSLLVIEEGIGLSHLGLEAMSHLQILLPV